MDPIAVLALGAVSALLLWEHRAARVARLPRPRARSWTSCRCPFCHEALGEAAPVRRCARCATRHHDVCWAAHGGCSVHGCARPRPHPELAAPLEEPACQPDLGDEPLLVGGA